MIVPSMSYVDIYRELDQDLRKVEIWANKLLPSVVKELKKRNRTIDWQYREYVHQESRNKYLISYFVENKNAYERPKIKIYGVVEDNGKRLIVQWGWVQWESVFVRNISFYSGHFFKRYRERLWPECTKPMNEQICRYFTRNDNILNHNLNLNLNFKGLVFIKLNEDIKRDYGKYGDNAGLGLMVKDGLCFVRVGQEGDEDLAFDKDCKFVTIVMYDTIVNKSTLTEGQKLAIKKELESNMEAMYASIKEKLQYLHRLQMLEGNKPELKDYF